MIYLLILISLLLTLILVTLVNIKDKLNEEATTELLKKIAANTESEEMKQFKKTRTDTLVFGSDKGRQPTLAGIFTNYNGAPCSVIETPRNVSKEHIETKVNPIVTEEKVVNPKAEQTKEQLEILERLAGQSIKESDIKIYFSKSTNSLVYRYKDSCVKKEYHGRLFLNYTLMKHNRVFKVLYKEDIEEFNKTCVKQEEPKEEDGKRRFYTKEEYRAKVEDFMNLKRSTMIPDETLFKKIGISREALHKYITKEELEELNNLRQKCRATGMDKLRKKGSR